MMSSLAIEQIILETAVGREKAVQAIDVHGEFKNCVVTFWVMSQFFKFLGASRGCADFRDPTAVFRFKMNVRSLWSCVVSFVNRSLQKKWEGS